MVHFRTFKFGLIVILFLIFIANTSKLNAQFIQATVSWVGDSVIQPNSVNKIQLRVKIEAGTNSISLSEFEFNTNGSSNPVMDITTAKLWHTGNADTFNISTAILLGSYPNFWATNFSFLVSSSINISGIYYFWLSYDIAPTAIRCDYTSAQIFSFKQNGTIVYPANPVPNGFSIIGNGCPVGLDDNEDKIPFTLNPNPATDYIQLSGSNYANEYVEIDIYDVTGRKIINLYSGNSGNILQSKQFSIHELNTGIYILVTKSERKVHQIIFAKQ